MNLFKAKKKNKIYNSRIISSNEVFHIKYCSVEDKMGNKVPNYLIVEPKVMNKNSISGSAIMPILNEKVGLLNNFRPALNQECLEIPHGFKDEKETIEQTALRELKEETGLIGKKENLVDLGVVAPDSGVINGRVKIFLVKTEKVISNIVYEFGLGKLSFYTPSEIIKLIQKDKLIDSFTLIAFYRAIIEGHIKLN